MNDTVAVLGPGAVGGSLAVRLTNAGLHVVCVAHPEAAGLIALAGLVLESPDGNFTARVEVVERLVKPVGLLLVSVKAPALGDALERVEPDAVSAGVVVPLLNGLEHMEVLRSRFDGRVAAGSISHYQAYRAGRVQIVEATVPPVITMASESLPRADVEHAAELLRRGRVDVRVGQIENRVLWHKLARIAPLAGATSASGRTVGELRNDPEWRPRLDAAIVEACAVAEADGVSLRPAAQWAIIEEMADETTTSAARDVVAGRRSELDAILGAVLRAAERLDVPCPTLTGLAVSAGLR
ncbi:MAG TPA: 2-dehydropantoate 2-reductase [Gaiellaceae bacterium]|jgi:2-dehydropantoate 2-reductase|nr:2-dehydropantoate 2-reductase [Gaiellaceae bacterium]